MKQNFFCFQISFTMPNQSTLDDLRKTMDNSDDDQERGCISLVEMLLEKVVKLEKGLKDLQLQDRVSCHKCEMSDQEEKVSESVVKNLNVKLVEMNRQQGEMQQDLLLLVETCADFEKDLIETKKKNEQLSDQVKSLQTQKKDNQRHQRRKESVGEKVKPPRIISVSSESPQPAFQPSVSAPVFQPASFPFHNFYLSGQEVWPELTYDASYGFQG